MVRRRPFCIHRGKQVETSRSVFSRSSHADPLRYACAVRSRDIRFGTTPHEKVTHITSLLPALRSPILALKSPVFTLLAPAQQLPHPRRVGTRVCRRCVLRGLARRAGSDPGSLDVPPFPGWHGDSRCSL